MDHISFILNLISKFPTENPSTSLNDEEDAEGDGIDLTRQLSQIRSRYKLLCSLIGVKPRPIPAPSATLLDTSSFTTTTEIDEDQGAGIETSTGLAVEIEEGQGIIAEENITKEVGGERRAKSSVWALQKKGGPPITPGSLSY